MRNVVLARKFFAGLSAVVAGSAMAEVPTSVTTAITGAGTDAATVAAAALVAVVGLLAFRWMRREAK